MRRSTTLALLALASVLLPLTPVLTKPGWPAGLKADEPAYFLMASSLAEDRDLRCELGDLERLFQAFPYQPVRNLILMSDDGWRTLYFGKPYLYPLAAAPAVALFGANGMLAMNLALTLMMIWLGARYLRRFNPEPLAVLFAVGFFLASAGFAYAFWLQPEVFNMAAVTAALYLGLAAPGEGGSGRLLELLRRPVLRAALSGACLALAIYNKPMIAALGLPVLWRLGKSRSLVGVGGWLGGCLLALIGAGGLGLALTGHPSPYLGTTRGGAFVCSPEELPFQPVESAGGSAAALDVPPPAPKSTSWSWLFRVPALRPAQLAENLGYFLWGRHTGLFLYFPFSLLCLGIFLVRERASTTRWLLLAALLSVALCFILWIPDNWQGGGGFFGNRYYVNAYPGLLFLVTRIGSFWPCWAGYALGGALLGPTLLSPFGRGVPRPTLQAHVRNFPFPHLPLELSLRYLPGYAEARIGDLRFSGRSDVFLQRGSRFWIHGATPTPVELWIQSPRPLDSLAFRVASVRSPNRLSLRLGRQVERFEVAAAGALSAQVELRPERPHKVRSTYRGPIYVYLLEVIAERGQTTLWTHHTPPRLCANYAHNPVLEDDFYLGAELTFLGPLERLQLDVYDLEWGPHEIAGQVPAGGRLPAEVAIRNTSAVGWPADGAAKVQLAYHWIGQDGGMIVWDGLRTPLPRSLAPGEWLRTEMTIEAPDAPGRYTLQLEPVFEEVAWFAERGAPRLEVAVEVVAGDPAHPRD